MCQRERERRLGRQLGERTGDTHNEYIPLTESIILSLSISPCSLATSSSCALGLRGGNRGGGGGPDPWATSTFSYGDFCAARSLHPHSNNHTTLCELHMTAYVALQTGGTSDTVRVICTRSDWERGREVSETNDERTEAERERGKVQRKREEGIRAQMERFTGSDTVQRCPGRRIRAPGTTSHAH